MTLMPDQALCLDPASSAGVTLVGAGPGDPDLITIAGLKALLGADVVVTDRLVSHELLARLAPNLPIVLRPKNLTDSSWDIARRHALLRPTGFEQEYRDIGILSQTGSDHAACIAASADDVIVRCGNRSLSSTHDYKIVKYDL